MAVRLIDANACIGSDFVKHEIANHESFVILDTVKTVSSAAELIAVMDKFGIEKSCAFHRAMYDFDPVRGNQIMTKCVEGYTDRILPIWAILPDITDKEFVPEVFLAEMKRHGVKLLKAYPLKNRYILCDVTMGEQLDLIQSLRIPLYLEPQPGYEYIYDVLKEFPRLTVILCNIGIWPSARLIYPLLKRYPNVCFETGDLGMTHAYEQVCAYFGSERLLYGSNFPSNSMGCSLNCLMNANLSDADRENIAHGNIERLLEGVRL